MGNLAWNNVLKTAKIDDRIVSFIYKNLLLQVFIVVLSSIPYRVLVELISRSLELWLHQKINPVWDPAFQTSKHRTTSSFCCQNYSLPSRRIKGLRPWSSITMQLVVNEISNHMPNSHCQLTCWVAHRTSKMAETLISKGLWSWPWPWIEANVTPSCNTHQPLPIYQISWKSDDKKIHRCHHDFDQVQSHVTYKLGPDSKIRPVQIYSSLVWESIVIC